MQVLNSIHVVVDQIDNIFLDTFIKQYALRHPLIKTIF